MISHISGEVTDKSDSFVVIDVGGLGYEVSVGTSDLDSLSVGSAAHLFTYFAVRENAQDLYGFTTAESKRLFVLLLSVSGVGPKVAMSICSLGSAVDVKSAIADGNVAYIQSANGVGKRGAEKVIVELKDKVGAIGDSSYILDGTKSGDDAHEALLSLGYSAQQASGALAKVDTSLSTEERIKAALGELAQ